MLRWLCRTSSIKTLLKPSRRRHSISFSTSPLLLHDTPPTDPNDHAALCFSLLSDLLRRNLIPCAQGVVHRMILNATSPRDAISVLDFASSRGMPLDMATGSACVYKLVQLNELQKAEDLFVKNFLSNGRGLESPDLRLLNSMVVCYCRLRKINKALEIFYEIFVRKAVPCREACSAVVRQLCLSEQVLSAYQWCNWISDAGVVLDFPCFNKLVESLCLVGLVDEALDVLHLMWEGIGTGPTAHVYKALFYKLYEREQVEDMHSLCWDMEDQGLFIDKSMYTSLMNVHCKHKDMRAAMSFFFRMIKMGCDPDVCAFTTLIQGFGKLGEVSKSIVLHNLMEKMGLKADPVTHHVKISRLCKEMELDSACSTLRDLVHRNEFLSVHSFTLVISSLLKVNRKDAAREVCDLMSSAGIVPDHVLFFILQKNLPGDKLGLALEVLQEIAKHGCGLGHSVLSTCSTSNSSLGLEQKIELLIGEIARAKPDTTDVAFGIYITALCELRKIEAVQHCMEKMVGLGCIPLLSTFNSLIKCYIQEGLFDDADLLIGYMSKMGVFPNSETYLVMINWCCIRGDTTIAFDLLDQMGAGVRPSVAIYDSIIGCLSREKRVLEAHVLFSSMLEAGVDLDQVFFVNMINAYSKRGWVAKALRLFEMMSEQGIKPNSRSYTALINGLVKKNRTNEANHYLKRMLGEGFKPNIVLYSSLINQYSKKGEFGLALTLLNLMVKSGIEPDMVACIILVVGYYRNISNFMRTKAIASSNSRKGFKLLYNLLHRSSDPTIKTELFSIIRLGASIESFKDSNLEPNLYLYNALIAGFCRGGRMEDAYFHFELMKRRGISPNQVTFTILINGYVLFGDIDVAIGLFNQMNVIGCSPDKIAYNALLQGLTRSGRLLDALSLLLAMHKRGFFPNKVSYGVLLNSLQKSGLSIDTFTLLEDMQIRCFL